MLNLTFSLLLLFTSCLFSISVVESQSLTLTSTNTDLLTAAGTFATANCITNAAQDYIFCATGDALYPWAYKIGVAPLSFQSKTSSFSAYFSNCALYEISNAEIFFNTKKMKWAPWKFIIWKENQDNDENEKKKQNLKWRRNRKNKNWKKTVCLVFFFFFFLFKNIAIQIFKNRIK